MNTKIIEVLQTENKYVVLEGSDIRLFWAETEWRVVFWNKHEQHVVYCVLYKGESFEDALSIFGNHIKKESPLKIRKKE